MKLSNTNNNSAASNFCLMDSILFEIMSCFIRTIVKYKDDLFVILEKLPLSCWIVNNKQPHARIQILFPGGSKDIYMLGGDPGRFSVVLRTDWCTFKTFEFSTGTPAPPLDPRMNQITYLCREYTMINIKLFLQYTCI